MTTTLCMTRGGSLTLEGEDLILSASPMQRGTETSPGDATTEIDDG